MVALSNVNGEIVERYSYDVFGDPNRTSSVGNPYLFTGRRYDNESGLYYYRARYYNSEIGRFLQTDPIPALNLYTYCGNNPLNWIDPLGLCKEDGDKATYVDLKALSDVWLSAREPTSEEALWLTAAFKNLKIKEIWVTDTFTGRSFVPGSYNCIAWSVGIDTHWEWPGFTVADFDKFYAGYNLVRTSQESADVALWVNPKSGNCTHAARRVIGNLYESKLGGGPRIVHKLDALNSTRTVDDYGMPRYYYGK